MSRYRLTGPNVQGSVYGWEIGGIRKKIRQVEGFRGTLRNVVTLGHGMFNLEAEVPYVGHNYIVLESGLVTWVIGRNGYDHKRD